MIKVKIKVKEGEYIELDERDSIESVSINRQLDSDIASIEGVSIASEARISVVNKEGIFKNDAGEEVKIKDGMEVEVYEGDIKQGKFYIVDYKAPTSYITSKVNIRAVDGLQEVLNKRVVVDKVYYNMSSKDYLRAVLGAVGYKEEDIEIKEDIEDKKLNYTVINGRVLREVLKDIMVVLDAYCYTDREGRVVVRRKVEKEGRETKWEFTGDDILSMEVASSMKSRAEDVEVVYTTTSKSEVKKVLEIKKDKIRAGKTEYKDYKVNEGNFYEVDNIRVQSKERVEIDDVEIAGEVVSFVIDADKETEGIIEVYGRTIEQVESRVGGGIEVKEGEGQRKIEIKSGLIQDKETAEGVRENLVRRIEQEIPYVKIKNVSREVGYELKDRVKIDEQTTAKVEFEGYIHSIDYRWLGENVKETSLGIRAEEVEEKGEGVKDE